MEDNPVTFFFMVIGLVLYGVFWVIKNIFFLIIDIGEALEESRIHGNGGEYK